MHGGSVYIVNLLANVAYESVVMTVMTINIEVSMECTILTLSEKKMYKFVKLNLCLINLD